MRMLTVLSFAALSMLSPAARATDTRTATTPEDTFLTEAASGGMMEVKLGETATKQALRDDVKQFGERMVRDHGQANTELKQLASRKSVTLPADMLPEHAREVDRVSKLRGDAFDSAYIQQMVKDHETDVAAFRREAKRNADPEVRAFAAKTLPTLEAHLQMAKDISAKLNRAASGRRPHGD